MTTRAILITRPNHDLITTYLFHWSNYVIKEAERKSIKVLDLRKNKANSKMFSSYIIKHKPLLVFFNGHGSRNTITGYDNQSLIEANKNEEILAEKIVYARSCDAADNVGQLCIRNGTLTFIGYTRKFAIGYSPSKITTPLSDPVAKLFIEPSNLIPISLLKGNTTNDAYRKSQEAMLRNFRFMLSTRSSQSQKDAAPYLWANRKYQVLLGDEEAFC